MTSQHANVQPETAEIDYEFEPARIPNDGRRLAAVSMGLAIGGIVVPIILSIAAIVTAGVAKQRLGRRPETKQSRSIANTAQVFSVIDMCGYVIVLTLVFRGM